MVEQWFNDDIQKSLAEHRYIVVTDAKGEGEFLLKYLHGDICLLRTKDEWSELEARYLAESTYADRKIVFYTQRKAHTLVYIQEYVQTAGVLVLDDMETYLKGKLFEATGKNTDIGHDKLLLAAKLSQGKDIKWWQSIIDGITEPLSMEDTLLTFLHSPAETKKGMDEAVWNVFRKEVYRIIGKPMMEQPAETLAQEVATVMFESLLNNTINGVLLNVYYRWTDSAEKAQSLTSYISNYAIPGDINPLKAHINHPFESLDRKLMKLLSDAMKYDKDTSAIVSYMKRRSSDEKARNFKPEWLKYTDSLCSFTTKGLEKVHTYAEYAAYYQQHVTQLDTAMRKIYVAWLSDEPTLRPLQEHYSVLNKELLHKWYAIKDVYTPSQNDILPQSLSTDKRTAIIVCDGLRLEIAETVLSSISDHKIKMRKDTAFAVLPSVTENGMSALFGCTEPTKNAQSRFNALKERIPEVVIMPLDKLNESVTAQKLVLNYGDIDQVAEKKQLSGLKDIDNYESELRDKIQLLFAMGYEKVVLTTDHGFVITGILDEADKEPRPNGEIQTIEERYILTKNPLKSDRLIEKEGRYFDSDYQYYAKTDKPFVTRGAYGYAHGGFTPQECIIPVYELSMDQGDISLVVRINNKSELKAITGNYFTVKLEAEASDSGLFTQERKVKVMLFAGNNMVSTNLYTLKPGSKVEPEFELTQGVDKVVIADKETSVQIDSCDIKRSSSRDVDGLF
jgi:hypothetical protein